jgi:hypothetical protein
METANQYLHDLNDVDTLLEITPEDKKYLRMLNSKGLLKAVTLGKEQMETCVRWGHPAYVQDFAALHVAWRMTQVPRNTNGSWTIAYYIPGAEALEAIQHAVEAGVAIGRAIHSAQKVLGMIRPLKAAVPKDEKIVEETRAMVRRFKPALDRGVALFPIKSVGAKVGAFIDALAGAGDIGTLQAEIDGLFPPMEDAVAEPPPAGSDIPKEMAPAIQAQISELTNKGELGRVSIIEAMWATKKDVEEFKKSLLRLGKPQLMEYAQSKGVAAVSSDTKGMIASAILGYFYAAAQAAKTVPSTPTAPVE